MSSFIPSTVLKKTLPNSTGKKVTPKEESGKEFRKIAAQQNSATTSHAQGTKNDADLYEITKQKTSVCNRNIDPALEIDANETDSSDSYSDYDSDFDLDFDLDFDNNPKYVTDNLSKPEMEISAPIQAPPLAPAGVMTVKVKVKVSNDPIQHSSYSSELSTFVKKPGESSASVGQSAKQQERSHSPVEGPADNLPDSKSTSSPTMPRAFSTFGTGAKPRVVPVETPRVPTTKPEISNDDGAAASISPTQENPLHYMGATSVACEQRIDHRDNADGIATLPGSDHIKLCSRTSIVELPVDVLINSANPKLKPDSAGVCKVIFDAAGKDELKKECSKIQKKNSKKAMHRHLGPQKCFPGEIVVTGAGKLKEKNGTSYIFHTTSINTKSDKARTNYQVGDVEKTITECYTNALKKMAFINRKERADNYSDSEVEDESHPDAGVIIKTAAMPIIGAGHYGSFFRSQELAIKTAVHAIHSNKQLLEEEGITAILCCHTKAEKDLVVKYMTQLGIITEQQ